MEFKKGYIFVGDPIASQDHQYEIAPGYTLKKANVEQIGNIKDGLNRLSAVPKSYNYSRLYETKPQFNDDGSVEFIDIDERDYKYWLIEHDSGQLNHDLLKSLKLSSLSLNFIFNLNYFKNEHSSIQCTFNRIHNFYEHYQIVDQVKNVDSRITDEMRIIYPALLKLRKQEDEFPTIIKSIDDYFLVDTVSRVSPFYVVCLLSIVENLLVNSPEDSLGNSINKQLQRKVELLMNRSDYAISLSTYFDSQLKLDKAISLIYDYRSKIAHGSPVDFNGKLKILRNRLNVTNFLDELIRLLLVHSLKEPQLIKDLKRC